MGCDHAANWTSDDGADYCTIPWYNVQCTTAQYYDATSGTCLACPAGTYRGIGDSSCLSCAAGTYTPDPSDPVTGGATSCTDCGVNTVAPTTGACEPLSACLSVPPALCATC